MQQLSAQHNYVIPVVRISRLTVVHMLSGFQSSLRDQNWNITHHFLVDSEFTSEFQRNKVQIDLRCLQVEWPHIICEKFHSQSVFAVFIYSLQTATVPTVQMMSVASQHVYKYSCDSSQKVHKSTYILHSSGSILVSKKRTPVKVEVLI